VVLSLKQKHRGKFTFYLANLYHKNSAQGT